MRHSLYTIPNTAWAIQSNLQGVITDTPVYEKNAWTGDAQLTAGTASTLFDTERLYWKLFQDMLDNQTAHGEVSLLAPTNQHFGYVGKPSFKPADCCGATPAWDAFWFVIPWEAYQRYGDVRALAKTYPAMQRYLDEWMPQWTSRDRDGLAYTLTSGLGDWVPPPACRHSTASCRPRTTRTWRASRLTLREYWDGCPTRRATTRCSTGSAATSAPRSSAPTACTGSGPCLVSLR